MNPSDPELMSYLVRMVIPIRREFGRTLDVHQFLHDVPYATEVIEEALRSKDDRLRGYATYLQTQVFGPRSRAKPAPPPAAGSAAASASIQAATTPAPATTAVDAQRAAMLAKYKSGLR